MAKRINSAQRLYVILKVAAEQSGQNNIGDVWAHSFNIENKSTIKRNHEVVENLGLLYNQFEVTKDLVEKTDYSSELYQFAFGRIDRILSVDNLSSKWASLKNHLTPDTLLTINWLSEVLPDEKTVLDKEFINEIEKQLSLLKESLAREQVPTSLKAFIERQVEIIEKALRQYGIIGTKSFRDALYKGYSSSHENGDIIAANKESDELSALGKVWKKLKEVPGVVINTNKTLEAGASIVEKGQKLLDFFQNLQP